MTACTLLACLVAPWPAGAGEAVIAETSWWQEISASSIKGRLQFGTRAGHRWLTRADSGAKGGGQGSGTFLGHTYGVLDTTQTGSLPMDNVMVRLGIAYAF